MALLEVRDVTSGYGELQILWGASLTVERGQLTALVGSNGVGKTTLLRTIVGQIKPWQGKVFFNGQDVSKLPSYKKAEMGIVMVPEGRQLFTGMTVQENLEMGATPKRARAKAAQNLEKVFTIFPRLKERATQKSGTMSGGEQQMLAVARGIMAEPEILMIDELSLGLAPVLTLDLFQSLRRLRNEGLTIMLVEQNVRMALKVSDYAFVLREGKNEIHGPSKEVEQNASVQAAYLGI
ncbi:MAG: ABC transporter ATP-binding protein [Caldilineae bacterium]|nr:ABC transporter ATP-binding protein [Anaerolineae bacterium]MCB0204655.1 ABC transporter ATP-binding protein [Anaerolineae bacterium]MCB0254731.1 ABC transporter ATP-binding protein [Anaerolineae bacterium]MCB9155234.1 ABC transporter ATP-binding protein [Caldilineae bacterium]